MSELAELITQTEAMLDEVKAEKARIFRERMVQAQADRAAAGIVTATPVYRNPIERAQHNPKNQRLAIAANCWDCQGRDADPHSRWRIGNCVSTDCPLWPHRPHQSHFGKPIPASIKSSFDDENIHKCPQTPENIQLEDDDDDE